MTTKHRDRKANETTYWPSGEAFLRGSKESENPQYILEINAMTRSSRDSITMNKIAKITFFKEICGIMITPLVK
jgi:hypothetical protein